MGIENYKILVDLPSSSPSLGFKQNAMALKEIIENSTPQFSIGIFGGWGSGKTTLMKAIERQLKDNYQRNITVHFSAWRYEKEEHLLIPLLDTVRDALVQWSAEHPEIAKIEAKTASTIGKVMTSLMAGLSVKIGVPGAIALSYEANKSLSEMRKLKGIDRNAMIPRSFYHAGFRALENVFQEWSEMKNERRIVVFIDDLDRCLPQGALDVLESMKLFLDLKGFVFVVGLDREVVEWCIDVKYAKETAGNHQSENIKYKICGSDYIRKIFQVPFTLAPVNIKQLGEFVPSLYEEAKLTDEQKKELHDFVEPHLPFLVTDTGVNPRQIKRYINGYIILRKMKPNLQPNTILALQTILYRPDWDIVRSYLYAYRDIFADAVKRQLDGEENAVKNLNPALGPVPESFLSYVEPDRPGAELLLTRPLDEYIYSGSASLYTQDPLLLDLIPKVAKLRGVLSNIGIGDVENFDSDFMGILHEINSMFKELIRGPVSERFYHDLDDISGSFEKLRGIKPSDNGQEYFEDWRKVSEGTVNRLFNYLVKLLDEGEVRSRPWEQEAKAG